jgi:hypothetical protein
LASLRQAYKMKMHANSTAVVLMIVFLMCFVLMVFFNN